MCYKGPEDRWRSNGALFRGKRRLRGRERACRAGAPRPRPECSGSPAGAGEGEACTQPAALPAGRGHGRPEAEGGDARGRWRALGPFCARERPSVGSPQTSPAFRRIEGSSRLPTRLPMPRGWSQFLSLVKRLILWWFCVCSGVWRTESCPRPKPENAPLPSRRDSVDTAKALSGSFDGRSP